jgi:hypothetical protein
MSEMTAEKTFVLGIGSQKAGTSWLHAYLSAAPNADMGFTKEYHVWDAIRSPLADGSRIRITPATLLRRKLWRIALFQRWPSLYYRFFAGRLRRSGTTLTGDITPSYASLSPADLREIREGFEARGIRVKIVFLMRDPVERCWSAARMKARRLDRDSGEEASHAILRDFFRSPHYQVRTRYDRVLATIAASGIPPADVYCGLYEEMFTPPGIERLSRFFDVPADTTFGERHVFSVRSRSCPPLALAEEVARFYADTYAAVAERFPRVRSLWSGFGLLRRPIAAGGGRRTA